ncbi:pentapeptide repeat-containing protein [Chamaesiphon sp. VAR_69_metabat_338]|uniref:pentapeptide repeat-containing protein n=1 Tax=Chamaesiphon sp. VAR_69_metabat_338 TaxID=2964704 RepID=UPI00286E7862|nr:pentapeptide repeat-containing protein [Chamaesiphon sp. VAR_69_metabat_338]
MSQPATIQRIRFEEVTPAHEYAAFLDVSIESLVAHLGLPIFEGYDDLDEMRLTFLTLPSNETVTLVEYLNSPQPGASICVDAKMQNIPQIVFDSCLKLQVPREEVIWFHPDWQEEIDRLYAEHGAIEKRPESPQGEELPQQNEYEPIDCFNHALRIYTRDYVPATYWAMLQHNLGLAYFNRNKGDRKENLERSIECFNKSLEIYTQNEFLEKWKINQDDLKQSQQFLKSLKKLIALKDIVDRSVNYPQLKNISHIVEAIRKINLSSTKSRGINQIIDLRNADLKYANLFAVNLSSANLSGANLINADLSNTYLISANLNGADLSGANLISADLSGANLINADLSDTYMLSANLSNADLRGANLSNADLRGANLSNADLQDTDVRNTRFESNAGVLALMKQDLITKGAIFHDILEDRLESKILVSL